MQASSSHEHSNKGSPHHVSSMDQCPLGFVFNSSIAIDDKCVEGHYPFVRTDLNYTISIQKGYWIGVIDNQTTIVSAQCFFCPFNKHLPSQNYIHLPETNLTDLFCGPMKRTGILCQNCVDGHAPAVDSEDYKCVVCSKTNATYSWIFYILGKFLPMTIILVMVIILNISVTSGPANSFVFFAQIISTTFGVDAGRTLDYNSITPKAETLRKTYISIYGFWNLDFFESIDIHQFCLGPNSTPLQLFLFKYITAAYPLLLLVIFAFLLMLYDRGNRVVLCIFKPLHHLLARCNRYFNFNHSIMDAFATFFVLSYAKFATTSAYLLYPCPLYESNGHVLKRVSYIDSTKDYISWEYFHYLVVSLIISIFVCGLMPAILLLYSIKPFNRFLVKFHMSWLLPGEKIRHFLNAFNHCYKDGRNGEHDRRYFSSLYFFARLIILSSYPFAINWIVQLLIQQILCTIAIITISILQPYKKTLFNVIDSCMFGILASINALSLYQMYLAMANLSLSTACYYIQIILIFIPLVYITFVIAHYLLFSRQCLKRRKKNYIALNSEETFSFGQFAEDTSAAGRME